MFLEVQDGGHSARIGLSELWGGTIVDLDLDRVNLVNRFDPGREIQLALYDGNARYDKCSGCTGVFGWNPVQGGDRHGAGTQVEMRTMGHDTIYIKTRPLQWAPESFGGGESKPVEGDILIEEWVSPLGGHWNCFHVHYRVTHLGQDLHSNASQELPAVYVNRGSDRLVYYAGPRPWTGDSLTWVAMDTHPAGTESMYYMPERWAAFVNVRGVGLAVSVNGQFPYATAAVFAGPSGQDGRGANYLRPETPFTFFPNVTLENDIYLAVGDLADARRVFEEIHAHQTSRDVFPPLGYLDLPRDSQVVRGRFTVSGWGFDDSSIARVALLIDGQEQRRDAILYGVPRPGVHARYLDAPIDAGFASQVEADALSVGWHVIQVQLWDSAGHVASLKKVMIQVRH